METEVWYRLQYSYKGADEWYNTGNTQGSWQACLDEKGKKWFSPQTFDYRVLKVTITYEVVKLP